MPPVTRSRSEDVARVRARRRAQGLTSIEAVLHQDEIASLDDVKRQLGLASRSDVLRVLIAKTDLSSITLADAAAVELLRRPMPIPISFKETR